MGILFGTDGVRGVANVELTPELAYRIGQAGAYVLTSEVKHTPKILVGKDTRVSGDMLESALVAGLCSVGAEAVCLGVMPTPAVAYLTRRYTADAGVVISASHNPFEFNGIKFFNSRGYKLPDAVEDKIEAVVLREEQTIPKAAGANIGRRTENDNSAEDYISYVTSTIDVDLKGLKVAVDCANGAVCVTAPKALLELGADVHVINNSPDGVNINSNCGSTHMEALQKFVLECKADVGLAFDGDADRMIAVDEKGNVVDGDQIMAIISNDMKKNGTLKGNTVVVTVMSNLGLDLMAKRNGINLVKTKVGDRYVLEEMLSKGFVIGGEQSGHVILLDYNTTGDGLITALQLLSVVRKSGQKLSELASVMQVFPQVLVNARVNNSKKHGYMDDVIVAEMIKGIETEFKDEGRVLIRPSGTEPLVRVMIEGRDREYITQRARELATLIEERLA